MCPENKKVWIGDRKSPILLTKILITKEHIQQLAHEHLNGTGVFVTAVKLSADNAIQVFIDGDRGVTINDCVALSRAIESKLDRDKHDFSLDVSSHGATAPLLMPRQYPKHIGRQLEVTLNSGVKAEGTLLAINDEGFTIEYSVRENKPIGKGKITVTKQNEIKYSEIKETKIKLKY